MMGVNLISTDEKSQLAALYSFLKANWWIDFCSLIKMEWAVGHTQY